jgi:xanthine dehydrogenase YagT iron-sulfur-binding subunit
MAAAWVGMTGMSVTTVIPAKTGPTFVLRVNGADHRVTVEVGVTLLDALRDELHLTGTKKGCDHGQCGACTVHVDGRRVLACLTLAHAAEGAEVLTIEGVGTGDVLHPLQRAFVECDALQCGYCTPGQIMSGLGVIAEGRTSDEAEIAEAMSGNLCRCGAYPMIREAIAHAAH